ncbi:glutathione peroxidase [Mucilaginibacter polytrichastri]|uniref:Glutathione peroxidase n=1 Tax=Mucilaginibacter polytrichastri TaxID=1302689 RepID=A0A1Q6A4S6_9SPHI|nr:glutathione peroxidase [Mucilaginibacter polytrichastri]OKS89006.1 Glutathione peroxidase-like protein BsaA [Mucilaginibacter polytrichastri]SFS95327.1 glutathione peroxidase [Mucilaginibacter polytrichastri]
MKTLALVFALLFITAPASVFEFKLKNIDGGKLSLAKYRGKKILIVNTASKCGFTKQYKDLQTLSEQYKDKVTVVGFPANNFGGQEPGTEQDIKTFCHDNFNVTFPMSGKVSVLGLDIDPLFQYLTTAPNPDFTGDVKWNFEKFLIDENGKLIHRYRSQVTPLDPQITKEL